MSNKPRSADIERKKKQIKINREASQPVQSSFFIKGLTIRQFFIKFSYSSDILQLKDLSKGNFIELLNIMNISDLKISFPKYV